MPRKRTQPRRSCLAKTAASRSRKLGTSSLEKGRDLDRDSTVTQSSRVRKPEIDMSLEPVDSRCLEPGTWVYLLARPSKTIYYY